MLILAIGTRYKLRKTSYSGMQEQEITMKKLDRFPIECRETKPNYQLDFSANLKPYSKTKTKAIT